MGLALLLVGLVLICVFIFGWLWLCAGYRKGGWRGVVGKGALQLSAVCLIYGIVRGQPLNGLFFAVLPPLSWTEVAKARKFLPFLTVVAWRTAPYAAAGFVAGLVIRPLRVWTLGLTLVSTLIAVVFVGDTSSKAAMCQSAAERGFTTFDRNSFAWSLANTPVEWQWEIHALAQSGGKRLGWSYRDMDWYIIPDDAAAIVTGPPFTCPKAP